MVGKRLRVDDLEALAWNDCLIGLEKEVVVHCVGHLDLEAVFFVVTHEDRIEAVAFEATILEVLRHDGLNLRLALLVIFRLHQLPFRASSGLVFGSWQLHG